MPSVLLLCTLLLTFTTYSSATYCICKDGAQDPTAYQKVIDYACGAGADCKAIQDNGPCFVQDNPKAICDYAVNSYFQNKGQTPDACKFSGAAAPSNNLPSTVPNGCTFPTSGGGGGGVGGGSTTGGMGTGTSTGGVPTSTPGGFGTSTGTGGTGGMGTPGSSTTGIYSPTGMGPTGSFSDMNPNGSPPTSYQGTLFLLTVTLFSGFLILSA